MSPKKTKMIGVEYHDSFFDDKTHAIDLWTVVSVIGHLKTALSRMFDKSKKKKENNDKNNRFASKPNYLWFIF